MTDKLRLKAGDAEDLGVIAACLQDARIPLREMVFSPDEQPLRRCVHPLPPRAAGRLVVLRGPDRMPGGAWCSTRSTRSSIAASTRPNPDLELTLLTIATGPGKEYLIHIDLVFEGDAQIQLRTNRIACRLDDFGAPEPCKVTPCDHLGQGWITEAPA